MSARRDSGFSLIELMVAITVLLLGSGALARTYLSFIRVSSFEVAASSQAMKVEAGLKKVEDLLRFAKVYGVSSDGSVIHFKMPVDLDGDGNVVDSLGQIEWGIDANRSTSAGVMWIQFTPTDRVTEQELTTDLNGDGDSLDAFRTGQLRLMADRGLDRQLTGPWLLQNEAGGPAVTGSGGIDGPIFAHTGSDGAFTVQVQVHWLSRSAGEFALERRTLAIPIINQESL